MSLGRLYCTLERTRALWASPSRRCLCRRMGRAYWWAGRGRWPSLTHLRKGLQQKKTEFSLPCADVAVTDLVSHDKQVVVATASGMLWLYNLSTSKVVARAPAVLPGLTCVAVNGAEGLVAAAGGTHVRFFRSNDWLKVKPEGNFWHHTHLEKGKKKYGVCRHEAYFLVHETLFLRGMRLHYHHIRF
eukprot:Rmarinus@m.18880